MGGPLTPPPPAEKKEEVGEAGGDPPLLVVSVDLENGREVELAVSATDALDIGTFVYIWKNPSRTLA